MDTVTESSMARAMAFLGGIGIIHSNCSSSEQAAHIRAAKAQCFPILSNPIFLSPSERICSLDDFESSPCILVTQSGDAKSEFMGYVSQLQWMGLSGGDKESPLTDYMVKSADSIAWNSDLYKIVEYFNEDSPKIDIAPVTRKCGEIVDVVARDDVERLRGYPRIVGGGTLGADGEWMVGAAIGTRESDKERLEQLVKAGANVVVLDSSQGNSIYQIEMIKYIKKTHPEVDVIGGNVVTMSQADNLIKAGVDMGSGSI
ncbi:hypothetical protein SAY86_019042 [Trapa natans]|uniref:IMP dehydrogenase/GMP reductase domain-containing protein n=1 Tax=Trapa natans TaxID=22666 RepID=A0AAN7LHE3_TRANT|nr:hypothetical protein SAY86_019042 [Trapa natans]